MRSTKGLEQSCEQASIPSRLPELLASFLRESKLWFESLAVGMSLCMCSITFQGSLTWLVKTTQMALRATWMCKDTQASIRCIMNGAKCIQVFQAKKRLGRKRKQGHDIKHEDTMAAPSYIPKSVTLLLWIARVEVECSTDPFPHALSGEPLLLPE